MVSAKKKSMPKDLRLATLAGNARRRTQRTGNIYFVKKAIRLYKTAAAEAKKAGDAEAERIFSSKAHNLEDFLGEMKNNSE